MRHIGVSGPSDEVSRPDALDADLVAVLQLKSKLGSGYHPDSQLLKEPLFRGLDRTNEMLAMVAAALPRLRVDRAPSAAALSGGALATYEVTRRVERGEPFRSAYRDVGYAGAPAVRNGAHPIGGGPTVSAEHRKRLLKILELISTRAIRIALSSRLMESLM